MFLNQFIPWLVEHLPLAESLPVGFCELVAWVKAGGERLQSLLKDLTDQGLEIGYCARSGEVDIRFVAMGSSKCLGG